MYCCAAAEDYEEGVDRVDHVASLNPLAAVLRSIADFFVPRPRLVPAPAAPAAPEEAPVRAPLAAAAAAAPPPPPPPPPVVATPTATAGPRLRRSPDNPFAGRPKATPSKIGASHLAAWDDDDASDASSACVTPASSVATPAPARSSARKPASGGPPATLTKIDEASPSPMVLPALAAGRLAGLRITRAHLRAWDATDSESDGCSDAGTPDAKRAGAARLAAGAAPLAALTNRV